MDPQNLPIINPNSFKRRFTRNFVKSLMKIRRQNRLASSSSASPREILHRYQRVKIAANKSMAKAAGSRRLWSNAMLLRTKNQNLRRGYAKRIRIEAFLGRKYSKEIKSISTCTRNKRKKMKMKMKMKNNNNNRKEDEGLNGEAAEELRKHIPGGGAMDLGLLLTETEHYIKCLNTQVEVMRNILDCFLL